MGLKVINVKNILSDGSIDLSNSDRYIALEEFEQRYSHFAVETVILLLQAPAILMAK